MAMEKAKAEGRGGGTASNKGKAAFPLSLSHRTRHSDHRREERKDVRHNQKKLCAVFLAAFGAGLLVLGAAGVAGAAGGYIGLGLGNAHSTFDRESLAFNAPDIQADEPSWRLFGGYRLNDHFSIEGGYVNLGKATVSENVFNDSFETEVNGLEFTAVGSLPVGGDFSVFGRGGLIFWHSDVTSRITGTGSSSKSQSGADAVLGVGVNYNFIKHIGLRFEFTLYDIDKVKAGSGDFQVVLVSGVIAF